MTICLHRLSIIGPNLRVFKEKWNFPLCAGSIDGKHIRIKCPWRSGSTFYNYKTFFSVVLLGIVDGDYRFITADIGAPGSQSDSGVFQESTLWNHFETGSMNLPAGRSLTDDGPIIPMVILGDEGFPLKQWLLKPFPKTTGDKRQAIFNYRLSRARRIVENAFGILAARWRILMTPIDADEDLILLIVRASVVLHNFLRSQGDMNGLTVDQEHDGDVVPGSWRSVIGDGLLDIPRVGSNNYTLSSKQTRQAFVDYFDTTEGALAWQEAYVMRGS